MYTQAMEILRKGEPKPKRYAMHCRQCDSDIAATGDEAHKRLPAEHTDPGHYCPVTPERLVFRCPVCSNDIVVFA